MGKSIFSRAGLITSEDKKDLEKRIEELEQALGDVHDVRRQAERDAMRRERAVMSRIDDIERSLASRLDTMEANLAREIASVARSLSRDLAAFRINPAVDTSALGTMMQKEIARQIGVMRAAQEKGAQDLKDSLARTLEYVASAQEQGFTDILKRHAAIEIGLVETAGQIAEDIEREHEALSGHLASLDTAQRDSGEAAKVRERKQDEQTHQLQQFLQHVASALETLATKKDIDLVEGLLRLQEANQRAQSMIESGKEAAQEEPSSLLAEEKPASVLILPHGVKRS
ncbi:hypothetical protein [Selenomonas sp.]|uniref:hypothetical protein n=1 Tax=Selenomonas sp. TaxID=2053611 RepID=UPI003FA1C491